MALFFKGCFNLFDDVKLHLKGGAFQALKYLILLRFITIFRRVKPEGGERIFTL